MRIGNKDIINTQRTIPQPQQVKKAVETVAPKASPEGLSPDVETTDALLMDILELSTKGKEMSDVMQREREDISGRYKTLMDEIRKAQEIGEGMAESMKVMLRCKIIAMRIMMGDNVPTEDERYLAENDIELYSKAKQLRIQKVDPKDYDSILEDEEDKKKKTGAEPQESSVEPVKPSVSPDAAAEPTEPT